MIYLRDLNDGEFIINSRLIETVAAIPETKVTLTTGKYFLVKNSTDEVVEKVIEYNRKIINGITLKQGEN